MFPVNIIRLYMLFETEFQKKRLKQLFSLSETDGLQLKRLFNVYDIM